MIRGKTRHQLFLPDELSKRLAAMAKSQKRARSDLLVEMVDAWMNRRAAPQIDDRIAAKLDRISRAVEEGNREVFIISHSLQRFVRFQLIQASALPIPSEEAKALGQMRYDTFLDSLARSLAGDTRSVSPAADNTKEGTR